jgi:hypothetical protein
VQRRCCINVYTRQAACFGHACPPVRMLRSRFHTLPHHLHRHAYPVPPKHSRHSQTSPQCVKVHTFPQVTETMDGFYSWLHKRYTTRNCGLRSCPTPVPHARALGRHTMSHPQHTLNTQLPQPRACTGERSPIYAASSLGVTIVLITRAHHIFQLFYLKEFGDPALAARTPRVTYTARDT